MPNIFAPEIRQHLLAQLYSALEARTIQSLRQTARAWGWPLRGTAKSDVVSQVAGYLSDPVRMAADILTLSAEERELLGWLHALILSGDLSRALQQVLMVTSGRQMTQKTIKQLSVGLQERGLIFTDAANHPFVPRIFMEWLPPLDAPRLHYAGDPPAVTQFTLATFNQHVQHLLSNIELDRPAAAPGAPGQAAPYLPTERLSAAVAPRPGLVGAEILAHWDYLAQDERALAGFLLEQLVSAGLCVVDTRSGSRRLELVQTAQDEWESLTPGDRLTRLRQRWLTIEPQRSSASASSWNELDLALHNTPAYSLRSSYYWNTPEPLHASIGYLRVWLMAIVQGLTVETWYSVERLCHLVYQIQRDLFAWGLTPAVWRWHRDKTPLDPNQMTYEVWQETYGRIIEAWLSGPLSWLLFAQIGYHAGRPAAFRLLSEAPAGDAATLPVDALRFTSDTTAVLRNTWHTGELRQLLRHMAVETARTHESTTYRIDVAAFRRTLQTGGDAAQLAESFAALGRPLPPAVQSILQAWQARAGRHQLYDHVAVIEFADDMHPEEARAIAGLDAGQFYQASPRCLVVLNPDGAQGIIDELRRRGYTPQVTP